MLTEDFFVDRTLYQKAYYPLFVFQRLLLTGVLVMLYGYPLHQIFIIFFLQLAVSLLVFIIN